MRWKWSFPPERIRHPVTTAEKSERRRTPRLDEEEIAAWRAFLRSHSLMLRQIEADLAQAGLPPLGWYDVLWALYEAPGNHLQPSALADAIVLSRSGLSRMIDRIEEAGCVRRRPCPGDRRAIHVELTDEGRRMLSEMWPVYARGVADHFLPALGEHSCTLRQALESVAESVRRPAGDEPGGDAS
jgi:DNA-binding MarR family transcriptional regulator